jgi:hypothetical protein
MMTASATSSVPAGAGAVPPAAGSPAGQLTVAEDDPDKRAFLDARKLVLLACEWLTAELGSA